MAIHNRADEYKEKILQNINDIIKLLETFIDPETWGHNEYKEEFIIEMEDELHNLRIFRRKLK